MRTTHKFCETVQSKDKCAKQSCKVGLSNFRAQRPLASLRHVCGRPHLKVGDFDVMAPGEFGEHSGLTNRTGALQHYDGCRGEPILYDRHDPTFDVRGGQAISVGEFFPDWRASTFYIRGTVLSRSEAYFFPGPRLPNNEAKNGTFHARHLCSCDVRPTS